MAKKRIVALEYMRGIAMLGVIGIHTGSQYLSNTFNNIHLIALLEIVTRFSVPIFFFISAFGLFYKRDLNQPFAYKDFLLRRMHSVLLPYLTWSFLYLLHYTLTYKEYSFCSIPSLINCLFFGLASYQLYFMVILLWFYLLMPLWIKMVKHMTKLRLIFLLIFQIAFDYYSSYILTGNFSSFFINHLIDYRLNYWVFHYLFIFILGAYCSIHYENFLIFLKRYSRKITLLFFLSLFGILGYYYSLLYLLGYSTESAINTAHQLSPAGIFYTIGTTLFLFYIFTFKTFPKQIRIFCSLLGKHSYFVYLFHPFAIYYFALFLASQGKLMTAPITILFFFAVTFFSILVAICIDKIGKLYPIFTLLLTGTKKK